MRLAAAPEPLQQLVAGDDAPALQRERVQEPELSRGQLRALPGDVRLHLARVDPKLLDLDRLSARGFLRRDAPPGCDADARDQLLHRERLDQVVVGADLQRVHAVVLRPARADDHDRRSDPSAAPSRSAQPSRPAASGRARRRRFS
jgi:hypothetical protein